MNKHIPSHTISALYTSLLLHIPTDMSLHNNMLYVVPLPKVRIYYPPTITFEGTSKQFVKNLHMKSF